jgi:hypothetical protein
MNLLVALLHAGRLEAEVGVRRERVAHHCTSALSEVHALKKLPATAAETKKKRG